MDSLENIFLNIKKALEKHSGNEYLTATEKYLDSSGKDNKPGYHLYGIKKVSLFNQKPKQIYVGGVIKQKNYVSFYFSPIYSHREEFTRFL